MSTHRRKYQLKARADRQRQTRDRIVGATVDLHRELGPARTTVADIARRAGVQRLTVYNNFPELGDLLAACQHSFLSASPPPNLAPAGWQGEPLTRLEKALHALYRWYRANAAMERNVHRDRRLVTELNELMRKSADPPLEAAARDFGQLIGTSPTAATAVRSLVRLALEFTTWDVLAQRGIPDPEIAKLMRRAVAGVAGQRRGRNAAQGS